MATSKKITTELSIDWYAVWIARVCPALLEIIGGGPGGSIIAKEATPAQRKMILAGAKQIAESAARIQSAFAKQQ